MVFHEVTVKDLQGIQGGGGFVAFLGPPVVENPKPIAFIGPPISEGP